MIIVNALVPVFGLILLGWYLGFRRKLPDDAGKTLHWMTFRLFMPILLFTGIARADLAQAASPLLLPLYFIPATAVFVAANWLLERRRQAGSSGLATSYSNNIMVGIPLVTVALGVDKLVYLYAIVVLHSLILFSLQSLYVAFFDRSSQAQSGRSLLAGLVNPIIMGLLSGALLNLSGLSLPAPLWRIADMLAAAALPMALLMLGYSLSGLRLYPQPEVWLQAGGKLLLLPALVWLGGLLLPGLSPEAHGVLVLMAACPTGVNVLAFSTTQDEQRRVSSVIFFTTLMSVFSLPLWMLVLS